jgi:hypothetical protein
MKFALLIGINYIGTQSELRGCINDIMNIKNILITKYGYTEENMRILTDNTVNKPTKANILQELTNLQNLDRTKYKQIWIHYSGHGSYVFDNSGDELDGRDECICPIDYQDSGVIIDDVLFNIIKSIRIETYIIFDSCHSGTAIDLPFTYDINVKTFKNNLKPKTKLSSLAIQNPKIIFISGCKDDQTSADAYINFSSQGAMTASLLETLKFYNYKATMRQLIKNMRTYLQLNQFTQLPQLSTSTDKIQMDSLFLS